MKIQRVNVDSASMVCCRCKQEKPVASFNQRAMPSGMSYYSYCKDCGLAYGRESYAKHAARIATKRGQRYRNDPVYREKQAKNGRHYAQNNAEQVREYRKGYALANKEKIQEREKWSYIKRQYGLSREAYLEILGRQGGVCAICQRKDSATSAAKDLFVDHCHATGRVRGLLCNICNAGLGLFKDDPDIILNAIRYLKYHKGESNEAA